jgi:predicted MFS family arabinose efflux permease
LQLPSSSDAEPRAQAEATVPDTGLTIRQYYIMVGLGAFVTTIAQPGVIGRLPFSLLLKNQLHFNAETLATFMFTATFAWNVKPIAGILSDSFPLFGTRRRHYMLLGAGLAAGCWLLMGVLPKAYWPLLLAAFGANAFMVVSSTVMGGLMVEAGRKYGISGRITSIRQTLQSAVSVSNGLVGGYLATMAFGWIVGIAVGLLVVLTAATFFVLTERPAATRDLDVLRNARRQLVTLVKSKTLWAAGFFLALVYVSPGFTTPLLYMQTDKLHFSPPYIGLMETIEGVSGLIGAAIYGVICRRFNLRQLLTSAIAVNALATLLYLGYSRDSAPFVHALSGFAVVVSELSLMDLAVRSTPRGCESLGFSLMMSARNLALGGSDVIGSRLIDTYGWVFHQLVWLNAGTTALVLIFIPFLPRPIMSRKDGDVVQGPASAAPPAAPATAPAI